MSRTHYIRVDAEVDLSDFEEDDLVDFLTEKGWICTKSGEETPDAMRAYQALKLGRPEWVQLAQDFICESVNKVIA